jgi:hypothetical protein
MEQVFSMTTSVPGTAGAVVNKLLIIAIIIIIIIYYYYKLLGTVFTL